jgi:oligopeptide transport system substrate-binding protein
MYRTVLGIVAALFTALAIAGLTFSSTVDEPADLRIANGTEVQSLDPQLTSGEPEARVQEALFEGLTRFDPTTFRPAPGVAESWDLSDDGTLYTFHLRKSARWSDGRPVTAHDFVYSWRRLLEPTVGAEVAYMLFPVRLAEAYNTFGGHADTLTNKVRPALAPLVAAAKPLEARSFQDFLVKHQVADPLRAADVRELEPLLGRRTGTLTAAELAAFDRGLATAAEKLRAGESEAKRRFGVDQGVIAKDDHTLLVELRAATPYFLELMSHHSSYPVPRWLTEDPKVRDRWFFAEHLVSNGPFRLARWVVNDHIRLEKSPTYWGRDEVRAERVDVMATEALTTSLNLYLTGATDWLPKSYPQELAPVLRKRPDFYGEPGLVVYFYRFNTTKPPLDDFRVRKALSLAIDRELITKQVLGLGQLPAYTFVPPGLPGYTPPKSALRHDVAEARRLLAEAGFPGGKGFPRIGILYNTSEDHKRLADVVADQLRRALGIQISAYNQEWQSYLRTTRAVDYEMARAGWIGDYRDPNTFLDMWVTNGGNNYTGYSSPLYDRLIQQAGDVSLLVRDPESTLAAVREPEALRTLLAALEQGSPSERRETRERLRMQLFKEAEAILVNDAFPILPVYFYVNGGLVASGVRGFSTSRVLPNGQKEINSQDLHPLREMWVARGTGAAQ